MALQLRAIRRWPFQQRRLRLRAGRVFIIRNRRYIVGGITTQDDGGRLIVRMECYETWKQDRRIP
jgi:hypothetical protein